MKQINIFDLILKNPKTYLLAIFFDLFAACLQTLYSVLLTNFTQYVIEGKYSAALYFQIITLVLFLIVCLFDYLYKFFQNKTIQHCMILYRNKIAHVSSQPRTNALTSINALNNDSARIEEAIRNIFIVTDALLYVFFTIIGLIYLHWSIMLFSTFMFAINMIIPKLEKRSSEKAEKKSSNLQKKYLDHSTDILNGKNVWTSYNRQETMINQLNSCGEEYEHQIVKVRNLQSLLNEIPISFSLTGQSLLMIFTLLLIIKGYVIPGTILSVGNLSGAFFNNLSNLFASYTRINGYDAVYREKIAVEDTEIKDNQTLSNNDISLNHISFSYIPEQQIINNFSYTFKSGKKYLIFGASGCGKSTILKLIFKQLENYEGTITIGDVDYTKLSHNQIHSIIGMITQDSYVFDDTIQNNITLGRTNQDINSSIQASKIDTNQIKLEDNAKKLSGGQIQRVCLARELYDYHPVVLMDEVANAVDESTAKEIYETLLKSERTIIAVAHYLPEGVEQLFDEVIRM